MKRVFLCAIVMLLQYCAFAQAQKPFAIVIHGGAGTIRPGMISAADEAQYKQGLQKALDTGYAVLEKGSTALDAVQAAIVVLENDSMFNAGKGAVYAANGTIELDASIMDGSNLNAGAIAGVTTIKNPIMAARKVMEQSGHVMLARHGAEMFAEQQGCDIVPQSYFWTTKRRNAYEKQNETKGKKSHLGQPGNIDEKYGTVGAVALDKQGNLAAGTSTGGMTNKKFARIGDSPIIGAGTYADNNSCAVSCTGWGEYFIRLAMAKAIADRVELLNMPVDDAAKQMIHDRLQNMGATGGVIVLDKNGNISLQFNTDGMHRAWKKSTGESGVELYKQ
ncbi:MAG: isoaspartyl peptidase/L-asparaginase [Taibaiella sp.]|nr:isoaspartyl peptidase/L-asparaginase [Taibaiella sp.]